MSKKRFTCPTCYTRFTRFWNMRRHSQELHNVMIARSNSGRTTSPGAPQGNIGTNNQSAKGPESSIDRAFRQMSEVMKMSQDYAKTMPLLPNFDHLNNLQHQLDQYKRQIEDIKSNYWILPNNDIEGVTGYFCRRCRTVTFRPVRDIGFDRTAQAKHQCDENKVKSLIMVACREIDHYNEDNFVAGELLKFIDFLFKGNKFLLASDVSWWFEPFKTIRDSKTVFEYLGIPERYPFHPLRKDHNLDWVIRAINNLDTKLRMTDNELMDFLRRLKSTYGVIETYKGPILSRILIKIVP